MYTSDLQAVESGSFDTTSVVGKYWAAAKKEDPTLKTQYDAVGKKYSEQRAFRQRWVEMQFENLQMSKEKKESSGVLHESQGSYEPFDIIVDKEGGVARPAAIRAALNYTLACIHFNKAGQEAIRGVPWVSFNSMTKRWEYLYLKKTCKDWFAQSYSLVTKMFEDGQQDDQIMDKETPEKAPKLTILNRPKGGSNQVL